MGTAQEKKRMPAGGGQYWMPWWEVAFGRDTIFAQELRGRV